MMSLGGSNGLFQGGNNKNFEVINDIKEIFGFPPKSQNQIASQFTSSSPSSFSFGGSNDGSYLPPKSFAEEDYNYTDLTTPLFRIFVLSTTPETPTTSSTSTITTTTSTTSTSTSASAASSITPTTLNPSMNATESTNRAVFKEEALAEGTTVSSVSSSPTGYEFQRNPSPQFKVDLIWSTLVPPSVSNAENEVAMNGKPNSDSAGTGYGGGGALPNNGLYLPPNKEYLPPSSQ